MSKRKSKRKKPRTKPPSPKQSAAMPQEEDKAAAAPSRAPLLQPEPTNDVEARPDKVSSSNPDLTVYMAGKRQNLTRIRADFIEAEIIRKFSAVAKIEQSRHSLKILCRSQQQKKIMLRGGTVAGVEVVVTVPWGKSMQTRQKARNKESYQLCTTRIL